MCKQEIHKEPPSKENAWKNKMNKMCGPELLVAACRNVQLPILFCHPGL